MSSHATITAFGKTIYCHNDGYPQGPHGVGFKLNTFYTDPVKVKELMALGDISQLKKEVSTPFPHSFNNPEPGVTVAYHRDRGEKKRYCKAGAREAYNYKFNETTHTWEII